MYLLKLTKQQYKADKYLTFQHSPPTFQHMWSSIAHALACIQRKVFFVSWRAMYAPPTSAPAHWQNDGLLEDFFGGPNM